VKPISEWLGSIAQVPAGMCVLCSASMVMGSPRRPNSCCFNCLRNCSTQSLSIQLHGR
jgi:hypothetical protein